MMISVHFTLLFLWMIQDSVSCVNMKIPFDLTTVVLGDPLTLNCSYNCSAGFVRGCWSKASENPVCLGDNIQGSFCTVSLRLPNVSTEDLKYNYSCYTEDTDHPQLKKKIERVVSLHVEVPNWTVTPRTETTNASVPAKPKDSSGGEFTGMKVLATVTVSVAMVLAALAVYLCLNRSRQNWNGKGEPVLSRPGSPPHSHAVLSPLKGSLSTQSERVTLRIPTPDNESDTEVPYADIMITVRGVSTPELTQVGYLTPGDQKEWWGDESRSHLQASRSADRLHVPQPREVSRKMSTNSEYAVITYA
ncbi:uncharacterized protein LOC121898389 isoform X1 [Thunnus maccoyii]|uniref:uncharacterized protein LOC121898389 isoform X1 n=1 Tax=Thunnus maccoyii TaxID=8240 RepID=UPI001C4CF2D2|nr:uncharacterized protein LOC121898389 isoform X1 [Thunnus maccoyii]XP_042269348.1 uncharacterized protein LOC121898389 isoform X1 [Thunnus maccoyii]